MTHRTGFYGDAVLSNGSIDTDYDSEVTGSIAKRQLIVTVDPSGPSDRNLSARRDDVTFVSENDMEATSFLNAHTAGISINSLGNVDFTAGYNSRLSLSSDGDINNAYGYYFGLDSIGTTNAVQNLYGYVFPDLSTVPNQSNIINKVAFANLDSQASVVNYGKYVNKNGAEVVPANHPGLNPSAYYTGEYSVTAVKALAANTFYFIPMFVPHSCTVDTLSVNVHSGTLTGGSLQLSIYKLSNGKINGVVAHATVAATTTGVKSVILSQSLAAGTYLLGVSSNIVMNIVGGIPVSGNNTSNLYGQTSVPGASVAPSQLVYTGLAGTYNTQPSFNVYPTLGSDEAWPLVWLKVVAV